MGTKEFKYKDPCLYCKREETLANNITEKLSTINTAAIATLLVIIFEQNELQKLE